MVSKFGDLSGLLEVEGAWGCGAAVDWERRAERAWRCVRTSWLVSVADWDSRIWCG